MSWDEVSSQLADRHQLPSSFWIGFLRCRRSKIDAGIGGFRNEERSEVLVSFLLCDGDLGRQCENTKTTHRCEADVVEGTEIGAGGEELRGDIRIFTDVQGRVAVVVFGREVAVRPREEIREEI